jgi:hypothetical protein
MGGKPLDKPAVWRILSNVVYAGRIAYAGETYDGEHEAIVDAATWADVQATLASNGRAGGHGPYATRRDTALLGGLLACGSCGSAMSPTYTVKDTKTAGRKRYRYYACGKGSKTGRRQCQCPTLPAGEIERFVAQEVATIARDPGLREEVLDEADAQLAAKAKGSRPPRIDRNAAEQALTEFGLVWQALSPGEQRRLMTLLVQRVAYHHADSRVSITFRPAGIAAFVAPPDADQPTSREAAA